MSQQILFGDQEIFNLEIPTSRLDNEFSAITPASLEDPAAAIATALADPLGFPPLARTLVPGDRVVIALDNNVPSAGDLVAGLVDMLSNSGHLQQCHLQLVFAGTSSELASLQLAEKIPADQFSLLNIEIHHPHDAHHLSYLAAAHDASPIYVNRTLCDADVILPIISLGLDGQLCYAGIHETLFRSFTDDRTRQRFMVPSNHDSGKLREDADEAAWLLGIQLVLGVIPGAGNSLLHVIAGNAHEVREEAELRGRAAWSRPARQAELVIATIEGRPESQGWIHIARALHSSSQLVSDGGMIVLCTELDCPPGKALLQLSDQAGMPAEEDEENTGTSPDALAAEQLALAGERARIYMLSRLTREVVERLGIAHVSEASQICRLGNQCDSVIVLAEADRTVIEEPPAP